MTVTTYLYRHFDKKERLLYVGITANLASRTAAHMKRSQWAKDVSRTTSESFPTRIKAAIAELQAIDREKPVYNLTYSRERKTKIDDAVMFSARVPAEIVRKIDVICKKEKIMRSDYIRRLLERAVK